MKKLFFIVPITLFIVIVLLFIHSFTGNPLSNYISKQVLGNYLEETYPENEYNISEGVYDFKFGNYIYSVVEIGSTNQQEYEFYMNGFFNPEVRMDGIYYANLDEQLMDRLSKQAQAEITPLLSERVDSIHYVGVKIEVLKGEFENDVDWSKELPLDKPINLWVQFESTKKTKGEFVSVAKQVKSILDQQAYDYEYILYNGSGFDLQEFKNDGYLKFSLKVGQMEDVEMNDVEEFNPDLW